MSDLAKESVLFVALILVALAAVAGLLIAGNALWIMWTCVLVVVVLCFRGWSRA